MINKIFLKLIVAVGITTLVIISIFAYSNLQSQSDVLLEEFERHANQLSETIKKSTHSSMLENEREQIYSIINTIGEEQSIREIRIFNKEGIIIYSNDPNLIGEMVDKKAESCYACHAEDKPLEKLSMTQRTRTFQLKPDSERILGIMNPIYNEKKCWSSGCHAHPESQKVLGVLDITMGLKQVDEVQRKSALKLLIFAVSAIVMLSLIIAYFVRKWLDKPIQELIEATHQIGVGNLNYEIKDLGNDELGILARSFNRMTKKLSEARLQLFQSDKLASLGRLAAGVAHEINNPLTGVLTYSSFLLKRTKNHPEIQEDMKVIVRETKRSREIVKGLLDFARQSIPQKNVVDIGDLLDNSISIVQNQLSLKHIKLIKNYSKDLPNITADANQIQQVFLNLIVNALDSLSGEKNEIKISTSLISLSPYGMSQIKNAVCRKRHNLMDNEVKIDGMPTIKVKATQGTQTGFVNLDPVYGKNRHKYSFEVVGGEVLDFFCSRCDISLIAEKTVCPKCGSHVYSIEVPPNGIFEGCTNRSCDWEKWQAMDEGGQRDFVEIKISDSGCGIPAEDLERIFEPFFSTKGQKGTGLGLAVIWGIIDNHNGTIKVESTVGKGTTFIINLPA